MISGEFRVQAHEVSVKGIEVRLRNGDSGMVVSQSFQRVAQLLVKRALVALRVVDDSAQTAQPEGIEPVRTTSSAVRLSQTSSTRSPRAR